jgi:alcohol dehydrogenase class IV
VAWVRNLGDELAVPGFAQYGAEVSDLADIVAKATTSSSMKGNPVVLTAAELSAILVDAL